MASTKNEYRSHQVYRSKEEARRASEQRSEVEKTLPAPLVAKMADEKRKLKV
jgi:hypothetical protein